MTLFPLPKPEIFKTVRDAAFDNPIPSFNSELKMATRLEDEEIFVPPAHFR